MFSNWREARLFSADENAASSIGNQPNVRLSSLRTRASSYDLNPFRICERHSYVSTLESGINRPGWCRRTIRTSATAFDGFAAFEQKLCLMLPYRLPRESADAPVRLNSGAIWPCIGTVSWEDAPSWSNRANGLAREGISMHSRTPAAHGWQEELHDR
jgi:hypothetical protein